MRGLFLLGCGLLLIESACSGSTSRGSSGPSEGGSGGTSTGKLPATTMTSSGGDPTSATASAGAPAAEGGQAGAPVSTGEAGEAGQGGSPAEVEADCGCTATSIGWWKLGGRTRTQHISFVDPCGSFQHQVTDVDDINQGSCKSQLVGGCDVSLGVHELNAAMLHPDVQAALAAAPVLYGLDMRDSDARIDHVEIDEKVIEIGAACDAPECAIPVGVAELGFLLGKITENELGSGCILEP